jgi:aerobic-type carbon monoxide dehydrogenase small subunit (CoxS/CutS family)
MSTFRFTEPSSDLVDVTVDGRPMKVATNRTLLASLLCHDGMSASFYCAIGQCFRCEVVVSGRRVRSCAYYPHGGEQIEALDRHSVE